MKKTLKIILLGFIFSIFVPNAYAHEAYVLTRNEFQQGISHNTLNPLSPLLDKSHWQISLLITACVILTYSIVIIWSSTKLAAKLDKFIRKASVIGPLIIRIALSTSFFYAALSNEILGPELTLKGVIGGSFIRLMLYITSIMFITGIYIEAAAISALLILFYISSYYGLYLITYANYFGELIVLSLFGSRILSLDKFFFGKKLWFSKLKKYTYLETPIVRVLYGTALIFASYNIKFLHQSLSVLVYNEYHLKDFFHSSAPFIASGAGLSELLIGFFILTGFAMRLTLIISLVFITLSLFYFRELLWPHLLLYGISVSLFINSADRFTIDYYLRPFTRRVLKKFNRIIRS